MESIFSKKKRDACIEFFEICKQYDASIDVGLMVSTAESYHRMRAGKPYDEELVKPVLALEAQWYKTIRGPKYNPDYSVYGNKYYLIEVWLCWVFYSGKVMYEITRSKKSLGYKSIIELFFDDVKTVADLGCGFGYSTAALAEIFKDATVFGTNIEDTDQFKIATKIGKERNFKIVGALDGQQADVVFASEYFEHFEKPVEHLIDVIDKLKPTYFILANAFGADATGHFDEYIHQDQVYSSRVISSKFNNTLKCYGFQKLDTHAWNGRPAVFKRDRGAEALEKFF